ncbi:MAG: orotate phosphoribosyltransferase [Methanomicrobiales archaeon]|nr:orotate phosphoribosyltransferase [Methanomicrobiales archaeon]NYT21510.1 orotate phosphoribosyltransferase [Methanomicrobiales archaeon]
MVNRIAELLREHGAVEYGDFTLASGAKSSYYLDVKTAITHPAVLMAVGEEMARRADFEVVAGVAVGGVPLAVATAIASGKPYAIIRTTEKTHGKGGHIIGNVTGKRVLLVEDVTTSGGSVIMGIGALRAGGAEVAAVVTVVDRDAGAAEALGRLGVHLIPLCTAREVVRPPD